MFLLFYSESVDDEEMLSSSSIMSMSSGLMFRSVRFLMMSFAVSMIIFVITFSFVIVCLCINDCAISGIVICFNIIIHVSLMFC